MSRLIPHASRFAPHASRLASFFIRHSSFVIFFAFLSLYTLTLSPGLLPADSGEFQVVVPLLGVAHPPGFALYTLLGKLFITLIPFGTPAYRLNLFSAFTSALTLVVVTRAVNRLIHTDTPNIHSLTDSSPYAPRLPLPHSAREARIPHSVPGLLAASILGVSTTFWSQATTANIRSLAALLTALMVYALIEYRLRPTPNRLALFAFTLSLAVVHHLSLAFIGVILAIAILWFGIFPSTDETDGTDKSEKHPLNPFHPLMKNLPTKILPAALAPLLILLYLPLRAGSFLAPPGLNTLPGFLQHVFATGFGGDFFYFANLAALPDRLAILLNILLFQFNAPTLILLTIGLFLFFRRDPKLAVALTLAFAVHSFVSITYRAPQTVEYLLPAYVILVITASAGLALRRPTTDDRRLIIVYRLSSVVIRCSLFIASLLVLTRNFPAYSTLSRDHSTRDYAASALTLAPPNAVILSAWHFATPMWYLQQIEGLRPDVTVEYVYPQGTSLAQNWVDRINANAPTRPTLVTNFYPQEYANTPYRFPPVGLLWQAAADPFTAADFGFEPDGGQFHEGGWSLMSGGPFTPVFVPDQTTHAITHWQAPADPQPINFFVQLIGPDGLLYGQMDVSHAQIAPHEIVSDRYDITPNVDAPPGEYKLVAGAYLPDGRRLHPVGAVSNRDATELATVTVTPRSTPPATRHPSPFGLVAGYDYDLSIPDSPRLYIHWRLDGKPHTIALEDQNASPLLLVSLPPLLGYTTTALDLPPDWQSIAIAEPGHSSFIIHHSSFSSADRYISFGPIVLTRAIITSEGNSYRVDLEWLADRPLTDDLIIKVDLVGENYSWRVQSDSVPAGGAIPTLKWIPGIVIRDRHCLDVGAAFPTTPLARPVPDAARQRGVRESAGRGSRDVNRANATFQLAVYDHFTQRNLPILDSRLALLGPTVTIGAAQP